MKLLALLFIALAFTANVSVANADLLSLLEDCKLTAASARSSPTLACAGFHITPICECVTDLGNGFYEVCLNYENEWGSGFQCVSLASAARLTQTCSAAGAQPRLGQQQPLRVRWRLQCRWQPASGL